MKKLLFAIGLFFISSGAFAQCNGIFPPNTVCGTAVGGSPRLPKPTLPSLFTQLSYVTNGDSNTTIASTTTTESTSAVFTAPRTWTLPAANSVVAGTTINVQDLVNAINGTNTLSVVPAGADFINLNNSTIPFLMNVPLSAASFVSDGVNHWMGYFHYFWNTGQCYTYTPIPGDNSTNLFNAESAAIAAGLTFCIPGGTLASPLIISVNNNFTLQSGARVRGAGQNLTVIQKTSNSTINSTLIPIGSGGGNGNNIIVSDITFDGNGTNQTGTQYSIMAGTQVTDFSMHNVTVKGGRNGSLLTIVGTGATPPTPDGSQVNTRIHIWDNFFDATTTNSCCSPANSDVVDVLVTDGLVFDNNYLRGGVGCGANGYSFEFNRHFAITNNRVDNCWVGMYMETSQDGVVSGNHSGINSANSANGDLPTRGFWFADANQSFVGGGYAGSKRVQITNNHVTNLVRPSGTTGLYCFTISAPATLQAQDIVMENNTCFQNQVPVGAAPVQGFRLEGGTDAVILKHNICRNFVQGTQTCILSTASYTPPGLAAGQSATNMLMEDNLSSTITPMQTPQPTCAVTGAGTGATCAVNGDSVDNYGLLIITAGTGASTGGNVTVTLSAGIGRASATCICGLANASSGWATGSNCIGANYNSTAPVFSWNNNGTALVNATTYSVTWMCKGR